MRRQERRRQVLRKDRKKENPHSQLIVYLLLPSPLILRRHLHRIINTTITLIQIQLKSLIPSKARMPSEASLSRTRASLETMALYEFADGLDEAVETVILGKRKAEKDESESTSSASCKDDSVKSTRLSKRSKRSKCTRRANSTEKSDDVSADVGAVYACPLSGCHE
ncbi:hypothetical protein EDD21DRAFT_81810 [Dissophora ornata]|nr:hypothetical protein EDD21DRAFT_81810 [Dissophora ornata]